MAKNKGDVLGLRVLCPCGAEHLLDVGKVHSSSIHGCDSCGYGSGTTYSWSCPDTKKYVSVTMDH